MRIVTLVLGILGSVVAGAMAVVWIGDYQDGVAQLEEIGESMPAMAESLQRQIDETFRPRYHAGFVLLAGFFTGFDVVANSAVFRHQKDLLFPAKRRQRGRAVRGHSHAASPFFLAVLFVERNESTSGIRLSIGASPECMGTPETRPPSWRRAKNGSHALGTDPAAAKSRHRMRSLTTESSREHWVATTCR